MSKTGINHETEWLKCKSMLTRKRSVSKWKWRTNETKYRLTAPAPKKNIRLDQLSHWPELTASRQRCKLPNCTKCNVHFCVCTLKRTVFICITICIRYDQDQHFFPRLLTEVKMENNCYIHKVQCMTKSGANWKRPDIPDEMFYIINNIL